MNIYGDELGDFVYQLRDLEKKYTAELEEIEQATPGTLICSMEHGNWRFLRAEGGRKDYHRQSITKETDVIATLCRKKYLQTCILQIKTNLEALEEAGKTYRPIDFAKMKEEFSKAYKMQPDEYFLTKFGVSDSGLSRGLWSAEYIQSSYRPEEKTNITSQGLRVRSKGELAIAEMLYRYEIPFRYEPELKIDQYTFAPDFQLMARRNGAFWYWEHCGLPYNEDYMKKHKWKISMYEREGIVPWENLIVTYNDRQGNINMAIVESEIKNKLL
jgi:hypothetical protein